MATQPSPQNQAFALAMFAGAAQNQVQSSTNDIAQQASQDITNALKLAAGDIGSWNVVWGPAVPPQPIAPAYSLNSMYVVQNASTPSQYVIAIGGTNFNSFFDQLEDLMVFAQVPWPYGFVEGLEVAPGAAISLGTALGLSVLQSMTPEASLPGAGKTLIDFLRTVVNQKVTITVAGHSLGGALAPTVALWLANTQQDLLCLNWDPFKHATINLQAFAGPTPGNTAFGNFLSHKLGAGLQAHYNSLDVVPHAWQLTTPPSLSQIYSIYAGCVANASTIEAWQIAIAAGVAGLLSACGGTYTALPGLKAFNGTFISPVYDPKADPLKNYISQLASQHIVGYFAQFGFNIEWMAALNPTKQQAAPSALLRAISDAGQPKASASAIVQNLQSRTPRKILIGSAVVDAPTGPNDPRAATVVGLVHAELLKQRKPAKT